MSYHLLSESHPRARKQHACIWCGEAIEIGEKYRHERSIYDRNFQNHHWHLECDDAFLKELDASDNEEFDACNNERPLKEI